MYSKNKIPSSIRWGIPYTCQCKIRKDSFGKQIYFGEDNCTQYFSKRLLTAIANGEFGDDWKNNLVKYPDGTIDSKLALYVCDSCGYWSNEERLDFYIPNDEEMPVGNELSPIINNGKYRLYKKYVHDCPNCHTEMREILHSKLAIRNAHLRCPKCHNEITLSFDDELITNEEQEYHDVLLAMISQSFMHANNDMIIVHLAENVVLYSSVDNVIVKGVSAVKDYLYEQAKTLRNKQAIPFTSEVIMLSETSSIKEKFPEFALLENNKAVLEYQYEASNSGIICTGKINKVGLIEYLIYLRVEDSSYEHSEDNNILLMRL